MADAEQWTLNAIKRFGQPDWDVIHSLWIKCHSYKEHAEIDFILITSDAVLLLEVKGGEVYPREDGKWQIGGRIENEGPFHQIRSAYYAIKSHVIEHSNKSVFQDRIWGYGVILPESLLNIDGRDPAICQQMLLDKRGFPEDFSQFIDDLTAYWKQEKIRLKRNLGKSADELRGISQLDRKSIKSVLTPLHRPGLSTSLEARDAELEIIRLTDQQQMALDFHSADKPLILVGAAGTGKTLLALQQIHRRVLSGERVLFVCFNKFLAAAIRELIDPAYREQAEILNYHQLLGWLNQLAGITNDNISDWGRFNTEVEERVMYSLDSMQRQGKPFRKFDYLVMDEAQDLMTAPFLDSLELLLEGGWKNGNWTICIDPRQAIFHDQFDSDAWNKMKSLGTECWLTRNCRNTKPIAAYAHGLSQTESVPTREAKGPMPQLVWYKDSKSYQKAMKDTVNALIHDMKDLSEKSRNIVVLSLTKDALPNEIFEKGYFNQPVDAIGAVRQADRIQAGTLQSFKGLESSAVVLVGLQDVEHKASRQLVYVGGTRAKLFLKIFLPENLREDLKDRMASIMELLQ
jgi:hypothetical protein